jgi:FtsZ-interacting cell division protein ZipA
VIEMDPKTLLAVLLIVVGGIALGGLLSRAWARRRSRGVAADRSPDVSNADHGAAGEGERRGERGTDRSDASGGPERAIGEPAEYRGVTDDDRERMRRHAAKPRRLRNPDDLLPRDADEGESGES